MLITVEISYVHVAYKIPAHVHVNTPAFIRQLVAQFMKAQKSNIVKMYVDPNIMQPTG